MEFRAQARFMRVSPQKARLVLELIKGQQGGRCAATRCCLPRSAWRRRSEKLLQLGASRTPAILSTEKNLDVDLDQLYVKNAVANDGPRMKRIRPAPMGRAFRYVRRIAHHRDCAGGTKQERRSRLATVVGEEADSSSGRGESQAQSASSEKAPAKGKKKAAAK